MSNNAQDFLITVVSILAATFLGVLVGINCGKQMMKKEAVEKGYAHYEIVDPATGKTEWKWGK